MNDSPSTNHWKELADLIGAEVPDEPTEPEEQAEPETPPRDVPVEDSATDEPTYSPLAEKPCVKPDPAPVVEKPIATNHWRNLAGELGLELPEPEPEPEPLQETEQEQESSAEPAAEHAMDASEQPATTDEFALGISDASLGTDAVESSSAESRSLFEDEDPPRSRPPESDHEMPLFEDPGLSLDAPGVLDAIFEEDEAETTEDDAEERMVPIEAEDEGPQADEDGSEAPLAAEAEVDETETGAEQDSEEKRGKRKKRRRRRRPSRKDRGESGEAAEASGAETEASGPEQKASDSRDGARKDPSKGAANAEAAKLKHRKIPTWEEAIDIVISANKETRSKSSGSGSRGRRRGRKKSQ